MGQFLSCESTPHGRFQVNKHLCAVCRSSKSESILKTPVAYHFNVRNSVVLAYCLPIVQLFLHKMAMKNIPKNQSCLNDKHAICRYIDQNVFTPFYFKSVSVLNSNPTGNHLDQKLLTMSGGRALKFTFARAFL